MLCDIVEAKEAPKSKKDQGQKTNTAQFLPFLQKTDIQRIKDCSKASEKPAYACAIGHFG